MIQVDSSIIGISCSIFKIEIEKLIENGEIDFPFVFLESMLHMYPKELDIQLKDYIQKEKDKNNSIILVYGDCSAHLIDITQEEKIQKVPGINCCEILLGKEQYRKHQKEGAFFLMNEWVDKWYEIFSNELQLNSNVAKPFMQDMHKKLIYLDTGIIPIPIDTIKEISNYVGLPYEIIQVTLDHLKNEILYAKELLENEKQQQYIL